MRGGGHATTYIKSYRISKVVDMIPSTYSPLGFGMKFYLVRPRVQPWVSIKMIHCILSYCHPFHSSRKEKGLTRGTLGWLVMVGKRGVLRFNSSHTLNIIKLYSKDKNIVKMKLKLRKIEKEQKNLKRCLNHNYSI